MEECIAHDNPTECRGSVKDYAALSGSGFTYPRCELGYEQYVERVRTPDGGDPQDLRRAADLVTTADDVATRTSLVYADIAAVMRRRR